MLYVFLPIVKKKDHNIIILLDGKETGNKRMRYIVLTLLLSSLTNTSHGWVHPSNVVKPLSTVALHMGSKGATKWEKKKAWLEKRGFSSSEDSSESDSSSSALQMSSTIIGGGRIGSMLMESSGENLLLRRGDTIPEDGEGPILIATRNDSLDAIVDNCPENRKKDLVFMQNGYLDNFLESKGLLDNTQVLLFVSVTALGTLKSTIPYYVALSSHL